MIRTFTSLIRSRRLRLLPGRLVLAGSVAAAGLTVTACGGASGPSSTAAPVQNTCKAQLSLLVQGPSHGPKGSQLVQVRLTNDFGTSCELEGYPTVTLQDVATGAAIGRPLADAPGTVKLLHLGSNATAVATIVFPATTGAGCNPATATGVEVQPPGESAVHVLQKLPIPMTVCRPSHSASSAATPSVYPLTLASSPPSPRRPGRSTAPGARSSTSRG